MTQLDKAFFTINSWVGVALGAGLVVAALV
jgi:hypothetical protein